MAVDKLVDSTQLDSDLTAVANAIRAKSGGSSQLAFPSGFVSEIQAIPSGGGDPYEIALAINANTLVSFAEAISSVKEYMFHGNSALKSFNWSEVTHIGGSAFGGTGIESVLIQNPVSIEAGAFNRCTHLSSLSMPEYTGGNINDLFNCCSALTTVNLPKVTRFGSSVFRGCSNLVTLVLPAITSIGQYFVYMDPKLKTIDFGGSSLSIPAFGLTSANVMDKLIIRGANVATLANINALGSTQFASGKAGGTLYVPQALISSYEAATNWSTILGYANNQILPIEGSIYETQYADGTPIA